MALRHRFGLGLNHRPYRPPGASMHGMTSSLIRKTVGTDRRTFLASSVLAAGLVLAGPLGTARARAADGLTLRLPAPSGPHPVGAATLYLVDRKRRDPWEAIPVREVMITVCYPARTVHGHPLAPQLTEDAAKAFRDVDVVFHHLPAKGVNWGSTLTHAHTGAPAQTVRRPVLVYSPGGGDPRTMGTGLAGELASHGWIVVTVDHPGDASEVDFPGTVQGREKVRTTVFRGDPRMDAHRFDTAIATRIADVRFVLDSLEALAAGRNPDAKGHALPEGLGRALDMRRVGVYGHSAGGTTAAEALYEDGRIRAAVNMEGYLDHTPQAPGRPGELFPVARYGAGRPLLLLGSDGFTHREELERSWSPLLAHPRGCARRERIRDAAHWVFTDYAALAPQLQAAGLMPAADRNALVGAASPAVAVPEVRRRVRSFFARHLPPS